MIFVEQTGTVWKQWLASSQSFAVTCLKALVACWFDRVTERTSSFLSTLFLPLHFIPFYSISGWKRYFQISDVFFQSPLLGPLCMVLFRLDDVLTLSNQMPYSHLSFWLGVPVQTRTRRCPRSPGFSPWIMFSKGCPKYSMGLAMGEEGDI